MRNDLVLAPAEVEAAVKVDPVEELGEDHHLEALARGIAVGVLAEGPPDIEAEPLEQALVVSPGVAGHEIVGLEVDPVDEARPDIDVVLDALEARHDLQAGVGLPLEPELVDAVAGM
ncbi:MAG: hypothetical protein H6P96_1090, partial [Candidatus Aminicenantes bacterium]|nr:hypothetical protein [Candidatus Aminicenantes bacterium]